MRAARTAMLAHPAHQLIRGGELAGVVRHHDPARQQPVAAADLFQQPLVAVAGEVLLGRDCVHQRTADPLHVELRLELRGVGDQTRPVPARRPQSAVAVEQVEGVHAQPAAGRRGGRRGREAGEHPFRQQAHRPLALLPFHQGAVVGEHHPLDAQLLELSDLLRHPLRGAHEQLRRGRIGMLTVTPPPAAACAAARTS